MFLQTGTVGESMLFLPDPQYGRLAEPILASCGLERSARASLTNWGGPREHCSGRLLHLKRAKCVLRESWLSPNFACSTLFSTVITYPVPVLKVLIAKERSLSACIPVRIFLQQEISDRHVTSSTGTEFFYAFSTTRLIFL